MAENVHDILDQQKTTVDREYRLKTVKERQNEERQRKLEELKAQAVATQKYKEQMELERRQRLNEIRGKEEFRRQQVEERKRAINQAEHDRLVSILRKNDERELRMDARKRSSFAGSNSVFAFGSSTPRMLDPTDLTSTSFWSGNGARRATSIQNISGQTVSGGGGTGSTALSRRQSERETDGSTKKRATSATGLERSGEGASTPAGCVSGYVGRRRTDLMPTIPSRDMSSSFTSSSSRKSLIQSPGRAYSMTRLDQLAKPRKRIELSAVIETQNIHHQQQQQQETHHHQQQRHLLSSVNSVTRSMYHLNKLGSNIPTPAQLTSSFFTGSTLNKSDSRSMNQLSVIQQPRMTRATQLRQQKLNTANNVGVPSANNPNDVSSRPSSSLSQQSTTSVASSVNVRHRPTSATQRRPRPVSIAITGVTQLENNNHHHLHSNSISYKRNESKPPLPKPSRKQQSTPVNNNNNNNTTKNNNTTTNNNNNTDSANSKINNTSDNNSNNNIQTIESSNSSGLNSSDVQLIKPSIVSTLEKEEPVTEKIVEKQADECQEKTDTEKQIESPQLDVVSNSVVAVENQTESVDAMSNSNIFETSDMTSSKIRINTEEEAKAALAERRRLVREEAERQAEQERARIEEEQRAEIERQRLEEEQVQKLVQEQRLAEQERLEEAIRETQKREEEERLRKEEELRQKLLKEEADKKAREETEKMLAENQKRLKNEEREREERRKRVEAIMRRTRGLNNSNNNSQTSEDKEDKNENKSENKINGTNLVVVEQENKNGKDIVDDLIPHDSNESLKNNTTNLNAINSNDTINSNNTWQTTQQFGGNLMCNNNI